MRFTELANAELFKGLSTAGLQSVSRRTVVRKVPKNTLVISEGEAARALYVIASGCVRVFVANKDGREVTLCTQRQGDHFGELALLDGSKHSASVVTIDACELVVVNEDVFLDLLSAHPGMMKSLLQVLARRIRRLTDLTRNLALLDVYGRIVRMLLELAVADGGRKVINGKLTHQQIAQQVGSSREMVSRIMKDLADGGYIQSAEGQLIISDNLPPGW